MFSVTPEALTRRCVAYRAASGLVVQYSRAVHDRSDFDSIRENAIHDDERRQRVFTRTEDPTAMTRRREATYERDDVGEAVEQARRRERFESRQRLYR